jgi:release factor glutamine methyltransferase
MRLRVTVGNAVADARHRLRAAGIPDAEAALDARLLAQHVLRWDTARLLSSLNEAAPVGFAAVYEPVVLRRCAREPIAYITGVQEFWGRRFRVTHDVLIPRPETELIVEAALDLCPDSRGLTIADVCTGSGCLAVSLAVERAHAAILASDISRAALEVAGGNAAAHGAAERIRFVETDLLAGIDGPFELIVANPPYVAERDRPSLPPEVVDHEPAIALFGGVDGLDVVRRLVDQAAAKLTAGGFLIFEFGAGESAAVASIIDGTGGLALDGIRRDLQGIPRVAVVRKR